MYFSARTPAQKGGGVRPGLWENSRLGSEGLGISSDARPPAAPPAWCSSRSVVLVAFVLYHSYPDMSTLWVSLSPGGGRRVGRVGSRLSQHGG